jgi:hypothetical protein
MHQTLRLTIGRLVAGSSARATALRLDIIDDTQAAEERREQAADWKPQRQTVRLPAREVPVLAVAEGTLRAEDYGKPALRSRRNTRETCTTCTRWI